MQQRAGDMRHERFTCTGLRKGNQSNEKTHNFRFNC